MEKCDHPRPDLCEFYGTHIYGRLLEHALDPGPAGVAYRRLWLEQRGKGNYPRAAPGRNSARPAPIGSEQLDPRDKMLGGRVLRLPPAVPCTHLGERTGERVECTSCPGWVELSVCRLHGRCIPDRTHIDARAGAVTPALCATCDNYLAEKRILLTGGIGDVFAVEAMLTDEERAAIRKITFACPFGQPLAEAWPWSVPTQVLSMKRFVYYNVGQVRTDYHLANPIDDLSVEVVFPQHRPYLKSSWLAADTPVPDDVPRSPYVVVVPASSWGQWTDRAFSGNDWAALLAFLERRQALGVIEYSGAISAPKHSRLLDLSNRHTLPQAIATLKNANGYVGIGSALSVLAAKRFPAERLAIKATQSGWGFDWRHTYYAPHNDLRFLQPTLAEALALWGHD